MRSELHEYDVIVSGAGPVGCTAACLIADAGGSVLLIEKRALVEPGRVTMPVCNDFTERVFQDIGAGSLFDPRLEVQGVCTDRMEHQLRECAMSKDVVIAEACEGGYCTQSSQSDVFGRVVVPIHYADRDTEASGGLLVDATGGRWRGSPLGVNNLQPISENRAMFTIAKWPYQIHLPAFVESYMGIGGTGHRNGSPPLFGANTAVDGAVLALDTTTYYDKLGEPGATSHYLQRAQYAECEGSPKELHTFPVQQMRAQRVVYGLTVGAGDALARVHFRTADGLNSGIRDALRIRSLWRNIQGVTVPNDIALSLEQYAHDAMQDHDIVLQRGERYFA